MTGERYPSSEARQSLAERLALPWSDAMQDWEWEVADAARVDEWLRLYASGDLSEDERFSLMEMLVQCVEDSSDDRRSAMWLAIEPHLREQRAIHRTTIEYWARVDEENPEAQFHVSAGMRTLLARSPWMI